MKITQRYTLKNGEIKNTQTDSVTTHGKPDRINIHGIERTGFYGFGAALTEAAAYTYALMSAENKQKYLDMVFGKEGLNYRICRICIGSSDFSLDNHVYIDEGDETLSTFSLGIDLDYVIPMARDVLAYRDGDVDFFASPWSPPAFMKDSGSRIGGHLKPEYYSLYAEYTARFVEEYAKAGIVIGAVTPQNEPGNGTGWETCVYTAEEEARYIRVLRSVFSKHGLSTKILCWDYNRYGMFDRASFIFDNCGKDADGVAFHWYSKGGCLEDIALIRELYPDKVIIESEFTNSQKNYFGRYIDEIRNVIAYGTNAVVEWNALLDERGMPCHNRDWGCISPLFYDRQKGTLYKSVNYNEIYLASHLIEKGDRILRTSVSGGCLECCAVKKPDGSLAVIITNTTDGDRKALLKARGEQLELTVPGKSDISVKIERM
ncbi:MAG: hypothetical protein MJ137_03280 [Clostridia bacterium]|nr:hypothetical protein [Clostridia bacterium]